MVSIMPPEPDSNKTSRKAISRRLRYEILRRDNNTCRYCHATDTRLTIDHVIPVALGGTDDPSNLAAACVDCNAGKTSSNPDASTVAQVSDDAARWAAAMKLAAERLNASKTAASEQTKPFHDAWYLHSGPGWGYRLPSNADDVLIGYLAAGLPAEVLAEAARIALRKGGVDNYWHYFQGVVRNMLADLQRDAAALLGQSEPVAHGDLPLDHPRRQGFVEGYNAAFQEGDTALAVHTLLCLSKIVDGIQYPVMAA